MRSGTNEGRLGARLWDGRSARASCGDDGLFLFKGWQGMMLDAAGSGSKEEAESTLRRVIVGILDW